MTTPILYEQHMHTPLCKHAQGEPEEYADEAVERGLKGIVVTCHNPIDEEWSPWARMDVDQLDDYVALVERARERCAGRVDVRLGMESDYYPGAERWLEKLHSMAAFNHVIGSVHVHLDDYKERYFTGSFDELVATYFDHVARSAETGLFDTLGHPDLVKNIAPDEWDFGRHQEVVGRALDRIAATGVAMELNTSGLRKKLPEMNPGPDMLRAMRARDIPVVMGADAHTPERVAACFEEALDGLAAAGYEQVSIFLERERRELPIAAARASLKARAATD